MAEATSAKTRVEHILVSLATLEAGLRKVDAELGPFPAELEAVERSLDARSPRA